MVIDKEKKKLQNRLYYQSHKDYWKDFSKKRDLQIHKICQKNWRIKQRIPILERDKYQCVICLSDKNLCVHHIDNNGQKRISFSGKRLSRKLMNNTLNNLITVCFSCHTLLHHKKDMKEKYPELLK